MTDKPAESEVERLRHEFEEMTKLHDEQFKAKNAAEADATRLRQQLVDLSDDMAGRIVRAEAEVERLKTDSRAYWKLVAKKAEATIERLKCCGNCKHLVMDTVQTRTIRIRAQVVLPSACTLQCGECDSDVTAWGRCMFTPSRWQRRQP